MTVRDVLSLSLMRSARVVAGRRGLNTRALTWVAVIEGPVEGFVLQGELILTSGMGCDDMRLGELVREVSESGAAAMCVAVGPGRFFEHIGPGAVDIADRMGFPLIEIPWEVRFSDVTRTVVQRTLAQRLSENTDTGRARFTSVVLDGLGFQGIADMLDSMLQRGVVILDREFRPQAFGRKAVVLLGDAGVIACRAAGDVLGHEQAEELTLLFSDDNPRRLGALSALGLGPGLGLAVNARSQVAAHVYALDLEEAPRSSRDEFDALTLTEAAEALAMESLRCQAAAEAEARVRGHFLWGLATGSIDSRADVARDASLLGYNARAYYHVGVLELSNGESASTERRLLRQGLHHELTVRTARRGSTILFLIDASDGPDELSPDLVEQLLARRRFGGEDITVGIAHGRWQLTELPAAYREAERTLRVGRTILGVNSTASATELGPFLMVSTLAEDAQARNMALAALRPLINYQRNRSLGLIDTLEAYLDENGNVSRTSRRLYVSRHSLLYRLEKIEHLTGFSLQNRHERFLLELSLSLLRFGVLGPEGEEASDVRRRG